MIGRVIKKSATDVWDELLYVIVFNVVWLVGAVSIIFWPFVTFGLFFIAKDIGDGKGIKFGNFFSYARQTLKPAYIWGGINLAMFVTLWLNLNFYSSFDAQWARIVQLLIIALAIFWGILQLIALGLYPHLVEPGFKLALRNAAVVIARQPLMILVLVVVIALFIVASLIFQSIIFLLPFSVIAIFANNVVDAIVSEEIERQEAGE